MMINSRSHIRPFGESADPELAEAARLLHTPPDARHLDRRRFLQGMLAVGGVTALGLPDLFGAGATAHALGPNERILVTILLSGGNDGLNTVVPLEDGRYRSARGALAVGRAGAHSVGDGLWLHPNLGRLAARFDQGDVAIVRGVGERSDDRSHFVNLARWMAGTAANPPWYTGWLGRWLDGNGANDLAGMSLGYSGSPLVHARRNGGTTSIPPFGGLFGMDYRANTFTRPTYDALLGMNASAIGQTLGSWAGDITEATKAAIRTGAKISPMFPEDDPIQELDDSLLRDATLVARLINLDVGARVINISLDGFDHHEAQRPQHDEFMASLDASIERILTRVRPEFRDRVLIMTYSEFGRRVDPTGSGSDHGTAAPLFVVGSAVGGGLYGEQPSLSRLDERGDLRHSVDFRSVYAEVLEGWLDADAREVLGANYDKVGFLRPTCDGVPATIVGTSGNDRIIGTRGRDVIVGLGGNDVIKGRGGNDLICAGGGNDIVDGGAGRDRIHGEAGRDRIKGGSGRDTLDGGTGRDTIIGNARRDRIIADRRDVVRGRR